MREKDILKILAISIVLLIVASGIVVGTGPVNNVSNRSSVNVSDYDATASATETISVSSSPLPDLLGEETPLILSHTYYNPVKYLITYSVTDNDVASEQVEWTVIVHDMAVTDIYTSPLSPTVGQSATIYVTVKNEGDQQENNVPVTVKAYAGLSPFGRQVGSTRVNLSAGESTTESFTWTPSSPKTYYIKGEVGIVSGETNTSDNTKTISVSVIPVRDMAVTNVYTSPQSPTVGQSTTIYVIVKNKGDQQENNVPVKTYVDSSQVGSTQVTLSAGESTTKSFTWTPSTAKTYSVKGEVGIVSGETDTSDNTKTISVSVIPIPVRDMAVTNVYTSPQSPTVGQSTTIYVIVKNKGDQQENNVPVKTYVDSSQVGSTQVTLSAGESTTKSFTWTPSTAKTYSVKGEVGIVSGETDTSDNTKTISVSVQQQNQPPTCAIELRKQGTTTSINEINVGEFFDIYVGDSTDDQGIKEVRFSSDDSRDGNTTGTWTSWYDWDTSSGDWNAETKIKKWSFATGGKKEVWAEVKDGDGQTRNCSANIYAIENQPPVALFTYSPENPVVNETITFNASSSYDLDGNITKYEWSFGDGNITNTTKEIITHAYVSAGYYKVNLTVTDDKGATSTYTQSIFINRIQKGISYAAWWHNTYATNDSDTSLETLKDTCTEWVSLVVTWYQDNASSTEIYRDDNRTPTDDSLIHAINKIHSLNMSVMLKPTVDLQDENWRGNINFDNIAYSDALGLGWQDWSWDCNRNFESATSVYRGKYAINVSFEPWGGLSFANPEGVNTDRYDSLEFYINGGERGGQQLRLSLTDDKGNELPSSGGVSINNPKYVHDGIISAKTWKLVSVPLEDLNATNTKIIKINIMDNTGHAQPTLYIDDVMLTAPQSKWNEWFSSYEQFILHYADLAEKNNCEQFCVGVEYKGTVQRENNWRDIIEKVREHYTGPITYASNWDNYQNITWWNASALDFVGIDAYFPLSEKTDPTVDELKEGWKKWEEEIESWQQRVNKSIIFTEIGYCSLDGTNMEPWNWTYSDIVDLQEQADCYNATFQTFWNKPWLAGIYWWMWDSDPDVGGPLDKSYTPYKKPAESIVKEYYCAEKVCFLFKERLIGGTE